MLSALSPIGATVAKTLFGLFVFAASLLAWAQFGNSVMRHVPLPGGDGSEGPCSIWFVGSSTIYRWSTMADDMAPWITHNRGVNGALVDDVAARLAAETIGDAPGTVILYLGENDIADGASADVTSAKIAALVALMQRRMPGARTIVLGMKPSPTRWGFRAEQLRFNQLIAARLQAMPQVSFVDFGNDLLVAGQPGPYYDSGGIHLNRAGYALWAQRTRAALERTLPATARCPARPWADGKPPRGSRRGGA